MESTTLVFEQCLGWRGLLAEGHPTNFRYLLQNRPHTVNLQLAICPAGQRAVLFQGETAVAHAVKAPARARGTEVACGDLGRTLVALRVHRIDFATIDVEGHEVEATEALLNAKGLSIGVVLVEVRADGGRPRVMELLLGAGFRYAGQLAARSTSANDVVDDCYFNVSHLRSHWPCSRALKELDGVVDSACHGVPPP